MYFLIPYIKTNVHTIAQNILIFPFQINHPRKKESLYILTNEPFDEQSNSDHIEYEEVVYVLAILLEERGQRVPLLARPALGVLGRQLLDVEARHARHVRRHVEEVLFGTFAVQPDRHEVALVLLHHQLEVVIR